jgi:uridine kinase
MPPSSVVVVEGLFLLSTPELRLVLDWTVFLDVPLDICLRRRIKRDCCERGRTETDVRGQWTRQVEPMFCEYIMPCRSFADQILIPAPCGTPQYAAQMNALVRTAERLTEARRVR